MKRIQVYKAKDVIRQDSHPTHPIQTEPWDVGSLKNRCGRLLQEAEWLAGHRF